MTIARGPIFESLGPPRMCRVTIKEVIERTTLMDHVVEEIGIYNSYILVYEVLEMSSLVHD